MNRSARVLALAAPTTPSMALLAVQLLLLLALARPAYPAASTVLALPANSATLYQAATGDLSARLAAEAPARQLSARNLDWKVDLSPARAPGQVVRLAVYDGQSRESDGRVHYSLGTNPAAAGIDLLRSQADRNAANSKLVVLH